MASAYATRRVMTRVLPLPAPARIAQRPRGDRDRLALGWIEVGQEVVGVADWHPAIVAGRHAPRDHRLRSRRWSCEAGASRSAPRPPTTPRRSPRSWPNLPSRRWWGVFDLERVRRDLLAGDAGEEPLVIEAEREVVGYIQIVEEEDPDFRHAGIDLFLRTDRQGRGLGPDAIRTVAAYLFDDRGHHRLTIDPAADNVRAIAAYAKVGFRPVGRLRRYQRMPDGRWVDGLLMELLAEELVR